MKVSVSLPPDDIEFLDHYAREHEIGSRSAVLHRAVELLKAAQLGDAYAQAWRDWDETEAADWDATAADGLRP